MAGINDYSNTPSLNTTINTIDVDEGCNPANINDAIRQLMADIADVDDGVVPLQTPDINGGTIDGASLGASSPITSATISGDLTVDTDTLYVDSTNNRVGIGTASPAAKLNIQATAATSGEDLIKLINGTDAAELVIDTSANEINFKTGTGDDIVFLPAGTEAMRIDSGGNVFVATTTNFPGDGNTTTGLMLQDDGTIYSSRASGYAASFNRNNDGTIMSFQRSGTTIGSIGVDNGANLTISGNSTHAGFNFGTSSVVAYKNGNFADNQIDLGTNITRYQNLYLGGNIYLGGTGSANALDDYEEGTFTPSAQFAASQPTAGYTTGVGSYTKVGNIVTVWGTVVNFNVTGASGDLRIRDLPFTSTSDASLDGYQGTAQVSTINYDDNCYVTAEIPDGLSYVRLPESRDSGARDFINVSNCSDGLSDVYFCVTYKTSS